MEFIMNEKMKTSTIVDMFYEIAIKFTNQTAVFYEGEFLTFGELDNITDNVAIELRKKGIKQNSIIATEFSTSIEMIISIISIIKAGGAYLPISPTYPDSRIADILKSSNSNIMLTRKKDIKESILQLINCDVFFIDDYRKYLKPINTKIEHYSNSSDLAYVIYTSGSTGEPKGVMIQHKNIVNLVEGLYENIYKQYDKHLNVALIASFVFDASVQQIFASLLLGHTLYIIPEEIRSDGNALIRYFINNKINICDGTPSHLKILQNSIKNIMNVNHFIIGGEVLTRRIVEGFYRHFNNCLTKITNIYGITECCVDSSSFLIERSKNFKGDVVPIGKPLKNSQIYILDENLNICKNGEIGEIYIAGSGVGRGYVNLPELTNQRFVLNPFNTESGIMYKTGDQGRVLTDGNIECIGRIDNQVKIRGYRIELGEIENKISEFLNEKSTISELNGENSRNEIKCNKCFLTSRVPELEFDEEGICSFCKDYKNYKNYIEKYFTNIDDFTAIIRKANKEKNSKYDCLLLYSGGKDSTYVLYKLKQMGLNVLTFTFDNGYISDTAFENIRKITSEFKFDNITMKMKNMDQLFLKELKNNSTVCNSCFRALTYLSTKLAYEKNINVIITGLSRGQIFETKLYNLYKMGICEPEEIDEKLLLYRKMYHSINDNVANIMGTEYHNDKYFENKYFIDYYRYDNVSTEEINDYLNNSQFWTKPENTGFCSTNCAINNVGIYMHIKNKKFHNYEKPLSWDYRLGVVKYENAIKKLDDRIDFREVNEILMKLGYDSVDIIQDFIVTVREDERGDKFLCAYFKCNENYDFTTMKTYLKNKLPSYMIPAYFINVKEIPLTISGKVDMKKLPNPAIGEALTIGDMNYGDNYKGQILDICRELLCTDEIGIDENFFEIGGDSFKANLLVSKFYKKFNIEVPLLDIYENPTISGMLKVINKLKNNKSNFDNKHLILIKKGTSKKNIFMLHDASGQVDALKYINKNLCKEFNSIGIRVDDVKNYNVNDITIESIAKKYIKDIKKVQSTGPYYLMGWSFGGIVAFEIVRQLEKIGDEINLLSIIDSETPGCKIWGKEYELLIETYKKFIKDCLVDKKSLSMQGNKDEYLLNELQKVDIKWKTYKEHIPEFIIRIITKFDECSNKDINDYIYLITSFVKALICYMPSKISSDILFFSARQENHLEKDIQWQVFTYGKVITNNLEEDHFSIIKNITITEAVNGILEKNK